MALVSRSIPALFNGVSQQPATLRLPSQAEAQVNAYGTVADGLRKRPPSAHIAKVSNETMSGAFIHEINRDITERYTVVVSDGDLVVYDRDGTAKTVTFPLGKAYLSVGQSDVSQSFALVSIADYTFVVNKTALVTTKTADTGIPANQPDWYLPPNWQYGVDEDVNLRRYYNTAQGGYLGIKQTFSELPNPKNDEDIPPNEGDVWKIAGYDQDSFGSYYVVRRGGVWEETHAPGASIAYDEATMPHALVRESDGTFSFRPFAWDVRRFGDDKSNPAATFVGRTLLDVFYYKNRLGFVSDENVVFSCAGDFGNFWRNTVTDLLDSDVVDVAVSSTKVSQLRFAVPSNNHLMLFADQTQFSLNVDQLLTPSSVSIDTVTEYEMSTRVRPVPIGQDLYFITESGAYSRVREYFVGDGDGNQTDATDITAHVPRYLPKGIIRLTGNANEDVLFALSEDAPNRVYVYKFFWSGSDKAQSSWSYWEFPVTDTILSIETVDNVLSLLIQRDDGVYLERIDVQSGATTGDLTRQVLLDRLTAVTGVYNGAADTTSWTLPYPVDAGIRDGFRLSRGSAFAGQVLSLVDPSVYSWDGTGTIITVPGDHSAGDVWAGQSYGFRYHFSEQFFMNGDNPVTTGRFMLRTFTLYYTDTAFFATEVSPYGTDPLVEEIIPASLAAFTGKTLGASSLVIGEPAYHTGSYAFQVYGDAKVAEVVLSNDTHVQCAFQSAEIEAFYHNRARSM